MTGKRAFAPPSAVSDNPVHPVAALDLPGLVPAPLDGMSEPIFDRIAPPPGDLLVDESYQRGLSARSLRLIRGIVERWDWLKFKPPVVAITDRGFEVIDGQHTAIAAACHPGISTIPILAVDGSDHERRARAFVSHAVDRFYGTTSSNAVAAQRAPARNPIPAPCISSTPSRNGPGN